MEQQVEGVCDYWNNIDLAKIKADLDLIATELTSRQDESEISRRKLVEMSRELKKSLSTETMVIVVPLIKNFQSEIDNLSKRSKMAESAFLSVYRQFIDLRDPVPAFQHMKSVQRTPCQAMDYDENSIDHVTTTPNEEKLSDGVIKPGDGRCCHLQDTYMSLIKRLREAESNVISLTEALSKAQSQVLAHHASSSGSGSSHDSSVGKETIDECINSDEMLVEDLSKHAEISHTVAAECLPASRPVTSPSCDAAIAMPLKAADDDLSTGNGFQPRQQQQQQPAKHRKKSTQQPPIPSPNNSLTTAVLRASIEDFRTELTLDTADVAQQVREILSTNNIGQRLFARHVLGLSQGTVSELLSKPKHWDKLTEKGRESYRRMHQWVCDGGNVALLKAYAPKKGSNVVLTGSEHDSAATEERISQILSEAQAAMMDKQSTTQVESAGSIVACIYRQELARIQQQQQQQLEPDTSVGIDTPNGRNSSMQRRRNDATRSRKHTPSNLHQLEQSSNSDGGGGKDSLTHDIVARIYREELSKLAEAAEASGNVEELAVYRRELDRLTTSEQTKSHDSCLPWNTSTSAQPRSNPFKSDVASSAGDITTVKCELSQSPSTTSCASSMSSMDSVSSDLPQDLRVVRKESCSPVPRQSFDQVDSNGNKFGGTRRSGSAFTPVQPRSGGARSVTQDRSTTSSPINVVGAEQQATMLMSPLQQMQSIANLLLPKQSQQRPLRAILPPISQDQIDRYTDINTDDLVRRVKDALSQYSISQRLFGETVLGLSQGSVSDLLARPKPWHLLTQKGREPFIRMQIFLEDEAAVSRLVASQYQIPADKFLRTGASSGNCVTPAVINTLDDQYGGGGGVAGVYPSPPSPTQGGSASGDVIKLSPPSTPNVESIRPLSLVNHTIEPIKGSTVPDTAASSLSSMVVPMWRDEARLARPPHHPQSSISSLHPTIAMLPPFFPLNPAAFFHPAATTMFVDLQQRFNAFNGAVASGDVASLSQSMMTSSDSAAVAAAAATATSSIEIDTLEMTSQIKEVLQFHNLGQKLFGEAVLGLSQGSVSELLSKPKPWRMLSVKGREPFVKMATWLADPLSVSRLRLYQDQFKARGKRRPSSADDSDSGSQHAMQPTIQPPANKKPRVFFTDEQKTALRDAYQRDSYPNQQTLDTLASELGVSTKTVVNWFHNHRMRAKQHHQQQLQQQKQTGDDDPTSPQSATADDRCRTSTDRRAHNVDDRADDIDTSARSTDDDDDDDAEDDYQDVVMSSDNASDIEAAVTKQNPVVVPDDSTTPMVNCDDNDNNVDVTVRYAEHGLVATKKMQQHWANNRRRKNSRPQWHYEGTVLDRSQRLVVGDAGSTVAAPEEVNGSRDADGVARAMLTPSQEDFARLLSLKNDLNKSEASAAALSSKPEPILVAAGCDSWR